MRMMNSLHCAQKLSPTPPTAMTRITMVTTANSNDSGSNDDTDRYNHLVDKPPREHGCQTKGGREGWGMADILSLGQPMRWVCAFT